MANKLVFNILGSSFSIDVDEDEAYLQKVLGQYHAAVENTQNISGINDPLNIAVLTGFLLCDEINKIKLSIDSSEAQVEQLEKRTANLIEKLDKALQGRIED